MNNGEKITIVLAQCAMEFSWNDIENFFLFENENKATNAKWSE